MGFVKAARQKLDSAAATVTATSEQIAQGIGAAIGLALVALLVALAAVVLSLRGRRTAAAAANG